MVATIDGGGKEDDGNNVKTASDDDKKICFLLPTETSLIAYRARVLCIFFSRSVWNCKMAFKLCQTISWICRKYENKSIYVHMQTLQLDWIWMPIQIEWGWNWSEFIQHSACKAWCLYLSYKTGKLLSSHWKLQIQSTLDSICTRNAFLLHFLVHSVGSFSIFHSIFHRNILEQNFPSTFRRKMSTVEYSLSTILWSDRSSANPFLGSNRLCHLDEWRRAVSIEPMQLNRFIYAIIFPIETSRLQFSSRLTVLTSSVSIFFGTLNILVLPSIQLAAHWSSVVRCEPISIPFWL